MNNIFRMWEAQGCILKGKKMIVYHHMLHDNTLCFYKSNQQVWCHRSFHSQAQQSISKERLIQLESSTKHKSWGLPLNSGSNVLDLQKYTYNHSQ
jgi:hypothetical protein